MTTPIREVNCDQFADMLADFLEREVPESTRAAMETHALACVDCGPLLADLRKLRVDAANLGELVPQRDLWAGIAERIETPVVAIGRPVGQLAGWPVGASRRRVVWLGLAAAGLVALTATITHQVTKATLVAPAQTVVVAPTPAPAEPMATISSPTGKQASQTQTAGDQYQRLLGSRQNRDRNHPYSNSPSLPL